jgi:TPR repeat protein
MYEVGDGVPQDIGRAKDIYKHACDSGINSGCVAAAKIQK